MGTDNNHITATCIMPTEFIKIEAISTDKPCIFLDRNFKHSTIIPLIGTFSLNIYTHVTFNWDQRTEDPVIVDELSSHLERAVIFTTDKKRDLKNAARKYAGTITVCMLRQGHEYNILDNLLKTQPFRGGMEDWIDKFPWISASVNEIRFYDLRFNTERSKRLKNKY